MQAKWLISSALPGRFWPESATGVGGSARYNPAVPTPFNHLVLARSLLERLSSDLREVLAMQEPAWLLGNIAPDVQTVSRQTRHATHFFPVPLDGAPRAHRLLFAEHPQLARPRDLRMPQAAFLTGYLAHLEFDQHWISDVYEPIFGPQQHWAPTTERIYLHNALRAWWDAQDLLSLTPDDGMILAQAQPQGWLPFVHDADLVTWRDFVADQLRHHIVRTAEVFAERMQVAVADFAQLVGSSELMAERVFSHCSTEQLLTYRSRAMDAAVHLLTRYWDGALASES